jgi:PIN domain
VRKLTSRFEDRLREILGTGKAILRPLTGVPHEELVSRALERRKPFASSGAGYRDALIWHTVLDLLTENDEPVVFVTNNSSDFAEPKAPTVLAHDLRNDLRNRGLEVGAVRLVPSLDAFAKEYLAPDTLAEGELDRALNSDTPVRNNFAARLREALDGHVFDRDDIRRLDVDRLDLGPDVDEVEIDTAEVAEAFELHDVWVISANLLDDEHAPSKSRPRWMWRLRRRPRCNCTGPSSMRTTGRDVSAGLGASTGRC